MQENFVKFNFNKFYFYPVIEMFFLESRDELVTVFQVLNYPSDDLNISRLLPVT